MGSTDFRSFAKAQGYSLKRLGMVSREAYNSLQNDFLIFTVPEIDWLVQKKYVRKNPLSKKWECALCKVEPHEILLFFKSHFPTNHPEYFRDYYREKREEGGNSLRDSS